MSSSSASGITSTRAKLVWREFEASNGEIRTSRCTPRSERNSPYASSPSMRIETDLMPASSPEETATICVPKPWRSAQRR